jgi:hypothetical protein
MTVLDRGEGFCPRRSPFVRRQSQGRFPAAPENLLVVNVGERLWAFHTLKVLSDETNREARRWPKSGGVFGGAQAPKSRDTNSRLSWTEIG